MQRRGRSREPRFVHASMPQGMVELLVSPRIVNSPVTKTQPQRCQRLLQRRGASAPPRGHLHPAKHQAGLFHPAQSPVAGPVAPREQRTPGTQATLASSMVTVSPMAMSVETEPDDPMTVAADEASLEWRPFVDQLMPEVPRLPLLSLGQVSLEASLSEAVSMPEGTAEAYLAAAAAAVTETAPELAGSQELITGLPLSAEAVASSAERRESSGSERTLPCVPASSATVSAAVRSSQCSQCDSMDCDSIDVVDAAPSPPGSSCLELLAADARIELPSMSQLVQDQPDEAEIANVVFPICVEQTYSEELQTAGDVAVRGEASLGDAEEAEPKRDDFSAPPCSDTGPKTATSHDHDGKGLFEWLDQDADGELGRLDARTWFRSLGWCLSDEALDAILDQACPASPTLLNASWRLSDLMAAADLNVDLCGPDPEALRRSLLVLGGFSQSTNRMRMLTRAATDVEGCLSEHELDLLLDLCGAPLGTKRFEIDSVAESIIEMICQPKATQCRVLNSAVSPYSAGAAATGRSGPPGRSSRGAVARGGLRANGSSGRGRGHPR